MSAGVFQFFYSKRADEKGTQTAPQQISETWGTKERVPVDLPLIIFLFWLVNKNGGVLNSDNAFPQKHSYWSYCFLLAGK